MTSGNSTVPLTFPEGFECPIPFFGNLCSFDDPARGLLMSLMYLVACELHNPSGLFMHNCV